MVTPCSTGWIAGLLEGEGSFILIKKKYGGRAPRVQMQSTDLDTLQQLQRWSGMGNINKVGDRVGRKPCWNWSIGAYDHCETMMRHIYPYMGSRRKGQIDAVMAWAPWAGMTEPADRSREQW